MSLDRRTFLSLGLGTAAAAMLPGIARGAPPLQRLSTRPPPDWTRLHPDEPHLVGVRPHREGGVRLELGEPLGAGKVVVHNYGHSGAGITLSMGCAEEAAFLVGQARKGLTTPASKVAILGTGIIGLTTAAALRSAHPDLHVTIYAKDLALSSTTSWVAGGQFEPAGLRREYTDPAALERLHTWVRTAHHHVQAMKPHWETLGFAARDNFSLEHPVRGFDEVTPRDVVPAHDKVLLPFEGLSVPGRRYRTWLLNPRRWMPHLVKRLRAAQVTFVERTFDTPADVAALSEPLVVNCTGYGARALFGDEALSPKRGHLVRLQRPSERHDYFFSGGCQNRVISYAFCRQDDIMIGGTFLPGDDRTQIHPDDAPVFPDLLENSRKLFGGRSKRCAWLPRAVE